MTLRQLLFCGTACGLALLASCSSGGSDGDDAELATQVADGTLPPWLAESEGGYQATSSSSSASSSYTPKRTASKTKSSASSKTSKKSLAKSTKSSSKSSARKSTKKVSAKTYTVKSGDAVERIARKNGVTTKALMKANNMKSDFIKPGQKLRIP